MENEKPKNILTRDNMKLFVFKQDKENSNIYKKPTKC